MVGQACVRQLGNGRKKSSHRLLHHLTEALLRDSFYGLKREAATGGDGVTWKEYETGLAERLRDLHGRVHWGAYRAQASRRIDLKEPERPQTPIGHSEPEAEYIPGR